MYAPRLAAFDRDTDTPHSRGIMGVDAQQAVPASSFFEEDALMHRQASDTLSPTFSLALINAVPSGTTNRRSRRCIKKRRGGAGA